MKLSFDGPSFQECSSGKPFFHNLGMPVVLDKRPQRRLFILTFLSAGDDYVRPLTALSEKEMIEGCAFMTLIGAFYYMIEHMKTFTLPPLFSEECHNTP